MGAPPENRTVLEPIVALEVRFGILPPPFTEAVTVTRASFRLLVVFRVVLMSLHDHPRLHVVGV